MIYICADDYGLCDIVSERICKCATDGALNKISVLPNFGNFSPEGIPDDIHAEMSLHLNLVEGRAVSDSDRISLIADADGRLKHTFVGLLACWLLKREDFENQVYTEIRAQLELWKAIAGDVPLMIDSHQHTHMIPGVFKALMRAVDDLGVCVKYLRIPSEPLLPYLAEPLLYLTYRPANLIKQWLLKLLGITAKRECKKRNIPTAYFMGILFSGKMDGKRVRRVLPRYISKASKKGADIEILFHPGYIEPEEMPPEMCNKGFEKFYLSRGRRIEFDTVMNFKY